MLTESSKQRLQRLVKRLQQEIGESDLAGYGPEWVLSTMELMVAQQAAIGNVVKPGGDLDNTLNNRDEAGKYIAGLLGMM